MAWQGQKVQLVPLDYERHFENCLRWINDPEVTRYLIHTEGPVARLAEKNWFDSVCAGRENDIIFAIETLDGRHIGNSGLHQISHMHKTAVTGTLIGEKDEWGKGYGTDAARTRARYAFDVLGLRMLLSEFFVGNAGSERMQTKVGYVQAGTIPKRYWRRGEYVDAVQTYLTREAFEEALGRGE